MAAWSSRKATCASAPVPNAALATWEMTVGEPLLYGTAWVRCAIHETPATRVPRMTLMMTSVRRALRPSGRWKAPTPLEMASSPVSEDPPLANALSRM